MPGGFPQAFLFLELLELLEHRKRSQNLPTENLYHHRNRIYHGISEGYARIEISAVIGEGQYGRLGLGTSQNTGEGEYRQLFRCIAS